MNYKKGQTAFTKWYPTKKKFLHNYTKTKAKPNAKQHKKVQLQRNKTANYKKETA